MKIKNAAVIITVLSILTLFSCPSPLDMEELGVLQDLYPPQIILTQPTAGSKYESLLTISGIIIDVDKNGDLRNPEETEFIQEASFILNNPDAANTPITLNNDGTFQFSIDTIDYKDQLILSLYAADLNGNTAEASASFNPDTEGPNLIITSPQPYSEYATVVSLEGWVTDAINRTTITEVNPVLNYSIPGTIIAGIVNIEPSGAFSVLIDVSAIDGSRTVEVTASDLNGNETTIICPIVKPSLGGDISGFTVTPGNREVTISWDDVLYAESYSLFESTYGELKENVSNPFIWKKLNNGETYSFQLTAHISPEIGEDAVSHTVSKMPLSNRTLCPWVTETGYKSITIEWQHNPNIPYYVIERSLDPAGPWGVRRKLSGSTFTDENLNQSTEYYYRVLPSDNPEIPSTYAGAEAGCFSCGFVVGRETPDYARGLCVIDDYAYVADNVKGLAIIDVSDPRNPGVPISVDTDGVAWSVTVSDDYAFVADQYSLAIIDVSDPEKPGVPSYIEDIGAIWDLDVADSIVYLVSDAYGLWIIDISNIEAPGDPIQVSVNGSARDVKVQNGYAYIADSTGVGVVDVQDLANISEPVYISGIPGASDITIHNDLAYISTFSSGLAIVDISNPLAPGIPKLIATYDNPVGVDIYKNYAIVAEQSEGIEIIDVNDPENPIVIRRLPPNNWVEDIFVYEDYIYTASSHSGLEIYSILLPRTDAVPYYPAGIPASSGLAYSNDYFYIIHGSMFYIYDASDPFSPVLKSTTDLYGSWSTTLHDIEVSGNYAYIARTSDTHGLYIMDITDKTAPFHVGFTGTYYPTAVAACGPYAFVPDDENGLAIIDISVPEAPSSPSYVDTQYWACDIVISEGTAYVADCDSGIAIIDISTPSEPAEPPIYTGPAYAASRIDVSGNYLFAGSWTDDYAIFDVSDPAQPSLITEPPVTLNGNASVVEVTNGYAYIGLGTDGLAVIDVSDPLSPGPPIYIDTDGEVKDIDVSGRYVFVSDGTSGLAILDLLGM